MPPSSFTKEQLSEIRKTSLARIICDNGEKTDFVQPSSMIASDIFLNAFQYCSTGTISAMDLSKWKTTERIVHPKQQVTTGLLMSELNRAKREVQVLRQIEMENVMKKNGIAAPDSPQTRLSGFVRAKRQSQIINNQSIVLELATNGLVNTLLRNGRDRESSRSVGAEIQEFVQSLPQMELKEWVDNNINTNDHRSLQKCFETELPCDHTTPFRSITGWCNNIDNPEFGKSFRTFDRLLPAVYEDGVKVPRRKSKSGKSLPSPRLISTTIHDDISAPHVRYVSDMITNANHCH